MSEHAVSGFIHRLRRVAVLRGAGEVLDAQLLERFVTDHEEAAFEALVRRHGPMVLGVCRQLLLDPHDAEDAFQATFLVLVRKAGSIQGRGQLASWLYGVAYRTALRARQTTARRRAREKQGVDMIAAAEPSTEDLGRDLGPVLHEELNRLPEKYRVPVVLCYLQGRTNQEAARQLAWPIGTVKGRLTRARAMLRKRLTRRGLFLSAGAFGSLLAQSQVSAALPPALLSGTVKAATLVAAGQAATAGVVSLHVAALTRGVLHTMFVKKVTIASAVLLTLSLVGTGGALLTYHALPAQAGEAKKAARPAAAAPAQDVAKREDDKDSEETDRQNSINALKLLVLAMHNYHDTNNHFPPAAVSSNDGKALLSWRVLLLPYVDQDDLFKEFKLDEPWDSEHNKKLLSKMPKIYAPVRGKNKESHLTHYQVLTGKGTAFEGTEGIALRDITDGTSNTIAIVEAAEAVPWTKPADLIYDPDKPLPKFGGMFRDVFHAAFADGSVHTLKLEFDEQTMRGAITRNGGEILELDKIHADR
jgi:RNA polymerase sigma factor (sigma-70 family)